MTHADSDGHARPQYGDARDHSAGPVPWAPATPPPAQPSPPFETGYAVGPERPHRAGRGRQTLRVVGWLFAALGVVALASLSGYLWITNEQWTNQNDQLRAEALSLGEQLATSRVEAESNAESLADVESQLETAKNTISTLADEDANAGDGLTFASDVIEQLNTCADERATLIDYLKDAERYTEASLRQAESDIDEFCASVNESWNSYLEDEG